MDVGVEVDEDVDVDVTSSGVVSSSGADPSPAIFVNDDLVEDDEEDSHSPRCCRMYIMHAPCPSRFTTTGHIAPLHSAQKRRAPKPLESLVYG